MCKNCRVTIVCCSNDLEHYNNELLASINAQTEKSCVLLIDNSSNYFKSCSQALNSVLPQIQTEFVIFAHQDIIFSDNAALTKFLDYMSSCKIGDIYGVAGTSLDKIGTLSAIYHGKHKSPAWHRKLVGIQKCDVVDECFFGGRTATFVQRPFNEEICDNWHLYAAEVCLHNRLFGHSVYVCEIPIFHTSGGKLTYDFFRNFMALCKAYEKYYPEIYTPCARSKTNIFSRNFFYLKMMTKKIIKRFLGYEE